MNKEKLKHFVLIAKERFTGAEVTSTSVMIAYYLLLSLFPMLIAVGNILPVFNIDPASAVGYIRAVVPVAVHSILVPVVQSLLTSTSGGLLSLGIIGAIWSSSKGVTYIRRGLNKAYGISDSASYIAKKAVSVLTIMLILLLLVVFAVVFSFSEMILGTLAPVFPGAGALLGQITSLKWPVALIFLFALLTLVYRVTPDVKLKTRHVLPGAALATLGLMGLVQAFSIYLKFSARSFTSYGALGTFFVLMLWLNFSAMLLIIGAVLNASISEYRFGKAEENISTMDNAISKTKEKLVARAKQLLRRRRAKPPKKK